ncbi:hypothetical protein [Marinobacter sp. JSM 1782161]|uniref:hypothetical protein n=1 Tax=Marinobacter sp. JSM 1782161 TaxID=2685906 RepID=UPI0014036711|nr:hypothetical protein [Marinobacter sp. JSM 1782161]
MSESGNPFIVLKPQRILSERHTKMLMDQAEKFEQETGCQVIVTEHGIDCEIHTDVGPLVAAIEKQTEAINALAASNMELVEAMAEVDHVDDEEREPATYMDGTPK